MPFLFFTGSHTSEEEEELLSNIQTIIKKSMSTKNNMLKLRRIFDEYNKGIAGVWSRDFLPQLII